MSSHSAHGEHPASPAMATVDVTCGLCRKRMAEAVPKLCHGCGLPVHLSCAQHVAARDCSLELGFPLPTVYCSSRCYETDFLGGGGSTAASATAGNATALGSSSSMSSSAGISTDANANATATATARWSQQVPNELTAALTLKIGDVSRTSRKQLSITTFHFLLSEGFDVFKAKVNQRATKELQACTAEHYMREDPSIYIRPGVHSKQAELVELSDRNFETRIRKSFRNFLKRKTIQATALRQEHFECDIFIYVKKESVVLRRTTASARGSSTRLLSASVPRQATNTDAHTNRILAAFMPPHQQHQPFQYVVHDVDSRGDASTTTTTNLASSSTSLPQATVGYKRRLSETHERDQQLPTTSITSDRSDAGYKSIRMLLNGSVVAVKVNVADLFAAFGVPPPATLEAGTNVGAIPTDGVV